MALPVESVKRIGMVDLHVAGKGNELPVARHFFSVTMLVL